MCSVLGILLQNNETGHGGKKSAVVDLMRVEKRFDTATAETGGES